MKYAAVPVEGVFEGDFGAPETAVENVYTDGEQFFIKDGHGNLAKELVDKVAYEYESMRTDIWKSPEECITLALK